MKVAGCSSSHDMRDAEPMTLTDVPQVKESAVGADVAQLSALSVPPWQVSLLLPHIQQVTSFQNLNRQRKDMVMNSMGVVAAEASA
jgi:hypothetical protein